MNTKSEKRARGAMNGMRTQQHSKKSRGFTLVEIMVVVLIIAVMAAILVPALGGAIRRANESSAMQTANRILVAAQVVATEKFVENMSDPITINKTDIENFLGNVSLADSKLKIEVDPAGSTEGGAITTFEYEDKNGVFVSLVGGVLTIGEGTPTGGGTDDE